MRVREGRRGKRQNEMSGEESFECRKVEEELEGKIATIAAAATTIATAAAAFKTDLPRASM